MASDYSMSIKIHYVQLKIAGYKTVKPIFFDYIVFLSYASARFCVYNKNGG